MQRSLLLLGLASATAVILVACAPFEDPEASADAAWVGTITTEGNVTTVVNESGSVWGGTATPVEEASIGVDAGDEPYMLDVVSSVWADDRRIYVVTRTESSSAISAEPARAPEST